MTVTVPARTSGTAAPARDPLLDNAKFLAIVLVVSGHLVEDLRDVPAAHALYFYVYLFHMPLFIVISGYLSRNFTFSAGKARKLISGLAVPYVIFEVAYSLPRYFLYGKLEISLLDPYYLTWFLMSLFLWRLSTPVWQQLRHPLVVAVGLSLLSGTSALPDELSMNRTFGLLPFYVLGLMLTPGHLELLRGRVAAITGGAVLAAALAGAFAVHRLVPTEWIRWRHSNHQIRRGRPDRHPDQARHAGGGLPAGPGVPRAHPGPPHLVLRPRRRHHVRLLAARLRGEGHRALPRRARQSARRGGDGPAGGRTGGRAVHLPGTAGLPVGGGAGRLLGVHDAAPAQPAARSPAR
ncbi:acyltransferase family protein [Microbispora triticiradicis]|uniref:acyltransferase family protein n=1 Tax=Microbispora triticiradicis TaxID=2200763 RepID=UPI001AD84A54|nr:acyltransferase family protein [Microbispora triticiradicis]